MDLYKDLVLPRLFRIDAEDAHDKVIGQLVFISHRPFLLSLLRQAFSHPDPRLKRTVMGIDFPNPLGLAAGMDKNASALPAWAALGFGFVEIGTITPRPQRGNDKPRIFRIPGDKAIINRLGFNNHGATMVAHRLAKWGKQPIPIGISVGKQKETPLEKAADDHDQCLEILYPYGDYFVLNISSPNTPELRELQGEQFIFELLKRAKAKMTALNNKSRSDKPLLVKIAPDMSFGETLLILGAIEATKISGLIATNTTVSREGLSTPTTETGGLSGQPLKIRSSERVHAIHLHNRSLPIIGVGGIDDGASASAMLIKGASLIQLYTGLVYQGPALPKNILQHLSRTQDIWNR